MTYIQRLLDTGAAPGPGLAPPPVAESPLMAADQRLGVFPDLLDPLGPSGEAPPVAAATAPEGQDAAADMRPPLGRTETGPAPDRRTAPPVPAPRGAAGPGVDTLRAGPVIAPEARPAPPPHPLQRLVEAAPLPQAPPAPQARSDRAVPEPQSPAEPPMALTEPAMPAPVPAPMPAPGPDAPRTVGASPTAPKALPPWPRGLAEITPDQFTPADAPPPPPLPAPAAPEPAAWETRPAPAPRPAEPPAGLAPSPLAGLSEHPPPPPSPAVSAPEPSAPPPERIVERIREVRVEGPTPPKPMTAAAQSVIGPLGGRRGLGWRPRQGGV